MPLYIKKKKKLHNPVFLFYIFSFEGKIFSDTLIFLERRRNMSEGSAYTDDEDDDGKN